MQLTRRGFLKVSGAALSAGALAELFGTTEFAFAQETPELRIKDAQETPTICCYCSVGCGAICSVVDGELVNLEGDPDHPINRGSLCSKGSAMFNVRNVYDPDTGELMLNPYRQTKPKYRAAGATEWEEVEWDWAIEEIAKRVKKTRDETFVAESNGVTVNRTPGIGFIGGAALDDEECYVIQKLARALGVIDIEHQARI